MNVSSILTLLFMWRSLKPRHELSYIECESHIIKYFNIYLQQTMKINFKMNNIFHFIHFYKDIRYTYNSTVSQSSWAISNSAQPSHLILFSWQNFSFSEIIYSILRITIIIPYLLLWLFLYIFWLFSSLCGSFSYSFLFPRNT